jgi:hypothetical protein
MTGGVERGIARGINGRDVAASVEFIDYAASRLTVTPTVTVHVRNRCFSVAGKDLFLPGFHAQQPESAKQRQAIPPRSSQQFSDDLNVSNHRPVYTDVDL